MSLDLMSVDVQGSVEGSEGHLYQRCTNKAGYGWVVLVRENEDSFSDIRAHLEGLDRNEAREVLETAEEEGYSIVRDEYDLKVHGGCYPMF